MRTRNRGQTTDSHNYALVTRKRWSVPYLPYLLLGPPTEAIYDDLDQLRKLRNRVHIQNDKKHFEPNDSQAFSRDRQISAERTLEKLIKEISTNHPRPASASGHVSDFQLPWDEHFP